MSSAYKSLLILLRMALLLVAFVTYGTEGRRRPMLQLPLPPLARVVATDTSGVTWQQSGEMGGAMVKAREQVVKTLVADGWRLDNSVVLGRPLVKSEIMIWVRRGRRVLFKVWEKEAGTCGFAWGEEE